MDCDVRHVEAERAASRNRRRLKNFVLKPKYQMNFGYHILAGGVVFFGVTALLIRRQLAQIDALLNQTPDTPIPFDRVTELFAESTNVALFGFLAYILFCGLYALAVSHRVAGPVTALVAIIRQLQWGDYEVKRQLRRKDELKPIHRELQVLAAQLREKDER